MKPDLYKALKDYACQSFEKTHAGLYTLLTSDKNFANHVKRKYRLKQYEQEGEFFMTANERWFHLIGFIDALIWFYRGNLLKDPDTLQQELAGTYCSDDEPPDEEDIADYKAGFCRERKGVPESGDKPADAESLSPQDKKEPESAMDELSESDKKEIQQAVAEEAKAENGSKSDKAGTGILVPVLNRHGITQSALYS